MSILETISHRESTRTYNGKPLIKIDTEQILEFIESGIQYLGNPITFTMMNTNDNKAEKIKNLSAYGMIRGAKNYIAGIAEENTNLVEYGFAFEQIALFADSIGLGTCWLGGTFKREEVSRILKINKGQWIPVMMPVGYAAKHATPREQLTRLAIKADTRKPFSEVFFDGRSGMPLTEATCQDLAEVMEAVRLAPSASNKQPWRLVVNTGGDVEFYIQRTPNYGEKMGYDIQLIDIGIAMWHFTAAAKEKGVKGGFKTYVPDMNNTGKYDEYEYIATFVRE